MNGSACSELLLAPGLGSRRYWRDLWA